jgi:hypothetical protein
VDCRAAVAGRAHLFKLLQLLPADVPLLRTYHNMTPYCSCVNCVSTSQKVLACSKTLCATQLQLFLLKQCLLVLLLLLGPATPTCAGFDGKMIH